MNDAAALVAALIELGFTPQVHVEPHRLEGYEGRLREERAQIIIPRAQVQKGANDVGFHIEADGRITAIISEYDSRRYNAAWLASLTRLASMHSVTAKMQKRGRRCERIRDEQTGRERLRIYA
jgi:hypothetical protein